MSWWFALLCLPFVVGCEGCRRDSSQETGEQEQQAPKEEYTSRPAESFPGNLDPVPGAIKPGHWTTAAQTLKSNKVDARGELQSWASLSQAAASGLDGGRPENEVSSLRPVVLPRGQQRRFDYRLLAPVASDSEFKRLYLRSRFVSTGRTAYYDMSDPMTVMAAEEYFFVVLTERPPRFSKFRDAKWAKRGTNFETGVRSANYRIVIPPVDNLLPLAETMLDWTATAVVFWDDISPDALTRFQQQAIADWVRFGGTLVVNGVDGSQSLARTGLADLLPLRPTGNIELDHDAGAELLTKWSVNGDTTTAKQIALLRDQSSRIAIDGQLAQDAQAIDGTGNLILTRQVGRGRVVQSRFDITSDWLDSWKSYDSFFNGVMLLRPRRRYIHEEFEK